MTTTTSPAGRRLVLGAAVVAGVAVLGLVAVLLTRSAADEDTEPSSASGADGVPVASAAPTPASTPTASPSASPSPSPDPTPSAEPSRGQTAAPDTRASTSVSVVTAAWSPERAAIEVSGLVDVVEAGGTCTLVVSLGSASATATSAAEPDATSTSCGTLAVARADLAPGRWSAVLRYDSPTTTGTAAPVTIEVPA